MNSNILALLAIIITALLILQVFHQRKKVKHPVDDDKFIGSTYIPDLEKKDGTQKS